MTNNNMKKIVSRYFLQKYFVTIVTIFWSKAKILVENGNSDQTWKFWSKIEFFVENRSFCRKSKFLGKIEVLVENRNFCQKKYEMKKK